MKPRIYKSGALWVIECGDLRYVTFLFETALWHALNGLTGVDPLPHWLACRLEPAGV